MGHHEITLHINEYLRDAVLSGLHDHGATGFIEEDNLLTAYFPDSITKEHIEEVLDTLSEALLTAGLEGDLTWEISHIADRDWNEEWKKSFVPFEAGERFIILPPWETTGSERIPIIIDPGMAFGTGHHSTTLGCLSFIEKLASRKGSFLDVGTGTGILAIAAAKLGFSPVYAVDTDPAAIESAQKNIDLNNVTGITLLEGGIRNIEGTFDLITANLVSVTITLLAGDLAAHMTGGGSLIVSGILLDQEEEVTVALTKAGLSPVDTLQGDKWVTMRSKKKG